MHFNQKAFDNAIELKSAEGDEADALVLKGLEEIEKKLADRIAAVETKSADQLAKLTAKLNRPAIITGEAVEASIETKAFDAYLRRGQPAMTADELKSMTVANDASGGYLAPEALAASILTKLVEFSPIRAYASVMTIGAESVKFPRQTASVAATWVDETADRTGSQPAFEQVAIKPFELATFTDLSTQLLEDNAYNLEGFLATDFAKSFGKTEGLAFVKGTGAVNFQPTGLMTAAGIAEVKTGVADSFPTVNPIDVLIGMFHALPSAYARAGVWVMNNKTLGELRKWKDGNGYPFILDVVNGGGTQLLGRPIVEAPDMDDVGAGKSPILFGDLAGYRIVDRVGLATLRDPFTLAGKGQVRIHARKACRRRRARPCGLREAQGRSVREGGTVANENITTSTDTLVYVAGESTAKSKTEFEALTWTLVGSIADIGNFGDTREEVAVELYGSGRRIKRAGVRDAGKLSLKVARDSFDAGQALIRAGFEGGKPNAFKVVLPDRPTGTNGKPTTIYVSGVILSNELEFGGPNNIIMQNLEISLTDKPLEIAASLT
ncbi:phage major capsid protein [Aureimonas leprariae]|uniref:Phage major capsid protein n=1 Tax=Plantimonas leprariae TaxID=2615207 RepID=A0A7V7PNP3_9HYPH|nr:phage major capsid protein [Aureimonas leprariae]KAB0679518.1 phage major capsid protein [Aureimonas leprariae]